MPSIDLFRLREETFVNEIAFFDELDSTNSVASDLISTQELETPLLVITEKQLAGRGRGANPWWSNDGALTFTLVVNATDLAIEQICKASLTLGLCVCQALERFAPVGDFGLKWPNDVFLENRKIAGILIERHAQKQDHLAMGIGINVNNTMDTAPEEIQNLAISMRDCLEVELDMTTVLIECLSHIQRRFSELRRDAKSLLDHWQAYDLLRGRNITVDAYGKEISGLCHGIDSNGALIVDTGDERIPLVGGMVTHF